MNHDLESLVWGLVSHYTAVVCSEPPQVAEPSKICGFQCWNGPASLKGNELINGQIRKTNKGTDNKTAHSPKQHHIPSSTKSTGKWEKQKSNSYLSKICVVSQPAAVNHRKPRKMYPIAGNDGVRFSFTLGEISSGGSGADQTTNLPAGH